jgi:hypothetical protein
MSVGDVSQTENGDLDSFYDFLYGEREGFVYAATKEHRGIGGPSFKQYFFNWPLQKQDLIQFTLLSRSRLDVYVAPAMFSQQEATKEYVIGADVVWAELDDPPARTDGVPPPTCRIASGGDGHEHWYWKVDQVLSSDELDNANRALTYHLEADMSGWDSTQVLRPPSTFNHKRKRETSILEHSGMVLSLAMFDGVPQPPPRPTMSQPTYMPPVHEVLAKYQFQKTVLDLFNTATPGFQKRSDSLMALGYHCAEMGMADPEILAIVVNADDRWGKFVGREDRFQRLNELVAAARAKYPNAMPQLNGHTEPMLVDLRPMGFRTLLNTEVKLEWQWEGLLQKSGYFLLTGPTGVGKTQFSLDAAGHMALGKSFLGREMKPAKIGFFSLEMGLVDLKYFLQQMQHGFSLEEQDVLEEQLQFFPLGEPLYMTDEGVRQQLDQLVGDLKLDGVIVDSLGSATDESLSDEMAKKFFHWNDRFRQRHDIFTWYIHHHRKANGNNRKPNDIADVFGSQYITSYATSVVCLWDGGMPNLVEYRTLKKRLAPKDAPFLISRNEHLHFQVTKAGSQVSNPVTAPLLAATDPRPQPPGQGPAGQQAATGAAPGGARTGRTSAEDAQQGNWSVGPKSFSDMEKKPDPNEITINLDMGGT